MERQIPKLRNEDSSRTTIHYNTRSSTCKGFSNTLPVNELASLRVTKQRSPNSDLHLPIDIIVEILKRLTVKTLARFLCVSKLWGTIIRSRDLRKLFIAEFSNRPGRLFFTFRSKENVCFVFSSNQTPNSGDSTYHLTHTTNEYLRNCSSRIHDLICYETDSPSELVVYNFTTKRSITLPRLESGSSVFAKFLCYDAVNAVYKVLCVTRPGFHFKVLTLGKGNEWRMVESLHARVPFNSHICTNGILYFDAYDQACKKSIVMSFDVRSDKFDLIIKGPAAGFSLPGISTMTRYEGKLAIISYDISANGSMDLWVLEDTTKHEWLKKVFVLPNSWTSLAQDSPIPSPPHKLHFFLNITVAGEFILAPLSICVPPFYVLYYDPKRNSMRKVSIEGIMEHEVLQLNLEKPWFLYKIFSSQVESLMFW